MRITLLLSLLALLGSQVHAADDPTDRGEKEPRETTGEDNKEASLVTLSADSFLESTQMGWNFPTPSNALGGTEKLIKNLFGVDIDLDAFDWDSMQSEADKEPGVKPGLSISLAEWNGIEVSVTFDTDGFGMPSVLAPDLVGGWVEIELGTFP